MAQAGPGPRGLERHARPGASRMMVADSHVSVLAMLARPVAGTGCRGAACRPWPYGHGMASRPRTFSWDGGASGLHGGARMAWGRFARFWPGSDLPRSGGSGGKTLRPG